MNFGDIFRGFFGYPRSNRRWHDNVCPDCGQDEHNDCRENTPHYFKDTNEEEDHPFHPRDDPTFRFFHFSEPDDMMKHFDDMFRSFDEVFRSMGIADFSSPRHGFPSIEGSPVQPGAGQGNPGNLRDRMLKEPDSHLSDPEPKQTPPSSRPEDFSPARPFRGGVWTPFFWGAQNTKPEDKVDRDLDGELKPGDLGRLFPTPDNQDMEVHRQQPYRAYSPGGTVYRGVSVHTYRSADGKEEERRTLGDGEGNEESTVTRAIGDQVHTVITHKDGYSGRKKKVENYTNMDERDRPDFDRKWNTPSRGPGPDIFKDDGLDDKSVLRNLFGFGFPGFGK